MSSTACIGIGLSQAGMRPWIGTSWDWAEEAKSRSKASSFFMISPGPSAGRKGSASATG